VSNQEQLPTKEDLKKKELQEFLQIKDFEQKTVYTTTPEELEEVLVSILSTGSYTKTFELFGGKILLTYQSITEEERISGYKFLSEFTEKNKDVSRIEYDAYMAKINIALQLVRTTINKIVSIFNYCLALKDFMGK